jgi:hypothetical protein
VLLAYVCLAVAYQREIPLFEAPDEPSHLEYVAFLAQERRLPRYGAIPDVPGQGMQPPLYYLLSAPLFAWLGGDDAQLLRDLHRINLGLYANVWPPRGLDGRITGAERWQMPRRFQTSPELAYLRDMRWPSLVFGLLTVVFTYRASLRAWGDPQLAVLSAGVLSATPQFLFTSAYVNNDTAATAIAAAIFWLVAAAVRDAAGVRRRHYLLLALLTALSLVTRNSILPGLAVAALAVVWIDSRPVKQRVSDIAQAAVLVVGLVGPYLAWNVVHRGGLLGMEAVWSSGSHLKTFAELGGVVSYFTGPYWIRTFQSYWARFGWMNAPPPVGVYVTYFALTGAGILGFVWVGGRARNAASRADVVLRHYLVAVILATFASHVWYNLHMPQPQGRHLFGAAPQIATVLAIGLGGPSAPLWLRRDPSPVLILAGLFALALYCLLSAVGAAYQ